MTDKSVWDKEIPVPKRLIEYIDQGAREKLPPRTQFHGIFPSGASYWARTAKIEATDADGTPTPFFLKVLQFEQGKEMVCSEFKSMTLFHSIMPDVVAEPIAWGSYTEEPDTHFFACRYIPFTNDLPDACALTTLVAELHEHAISPEGEFGSLHIGFGGRNPQYFPPSKSWEECFSNGLTAIFDMEEETQGPDEKMRSLREGLMTKVIPRLLRPLETEGRVLTPRLVHGDLWDGNTAYRKRVPATEPVEDFQDRGALYMFAMNTMRDLLDKYAHGYEGYEQGQALVDAGQTVES